MSAVLHTLFDGEALGRRVEEQFDVGAVTQCRLWRSFINDVYRLEASGQVWWLRVHPAGWRSTAQTQAEVEAILAIAAAGGSVAAPNPTRDGGHLFEVAASEGPRNAVLFANAAGAELAFGSDDGVVNAARYGAACARLHNACEGMALSAGRMAWDADFILTRPVQSLLKCVRPGNRADLHRIGARLTEALASPELTRGFCNGDLNTQNIHFAGDKATVFDFDCSATGWRAFELSAFARGVTWRLGVEPEGVIASFYDGYRSERGIAAADIEAQAPMLMIQRLWVGALHLDGADRWGEGMFGQPYVDGLMMWLRQWEGALDSPPAWSRAG